VNASALLSIVIPARNAAETLAQTLDSLLAQTSRDWEAIVVDDGSTDSTLQVAQAYVARDGRFRLLADGRPSEGASAARNRAIGEAKGRWLLCLDSDDWIEPTFIIRMVGALEAHPGAKVAYCGGRYASMDGRLGPALFSEEVARAPFEIFARQCPVFIHGFVLDRALVVALGGFDRSLRTSEDWDLWQRVARTGVAFLPVPQPLAVYRLRPNSLSTDARLMLADAQVVIGRAFVPDGADPEGAGSRELAVGEFALWCAAFDVGAGGSGTELVMPLPYGWGDCVERCRTTLLAGLRSGARALPGDPIADSPAFLEQLRPLLDRVERAAGRPGLARVLEYVLEPDVFRPGRLTESLADDRVLYVRRDVADLQPVEVTAGIDRLNIEFRAGMQTLARASAPIFEALGARDLTAMAIRSVSLSVFLEKSELWRRPRFWFHLVAALIRLPATLLHARPRRGPKSVFRPSAIARVALTDAALASAQPHAAAPHERTLARLIAEGKAGADAVDIEPPPVERAFSQQGDDPDTDRKTYWDRIYRTPDPWAYGSDYEQLKYRRTLDLLPSGPIGKAVELACSEGRFTEMLAARVGRLTAVDISTIALDRARARCRDIANVDFLCLDFFDNDPPREVDLLVCSEVLYYLADRTHLARVSKRFAAALAPGGHLLVAHVQLLKDDPAVTGFDWDSPFGGRVIAETLSATPGLALERSTQTELYRIDLFRRLRDGETPSPARIDTVELGPPPEPPHARDIVWGGAEARRADVRVRETALQLPILMYHRIAEDGPPGLARYRMSPAAFAGQMRWLRRHGYHAVTSNDIAGHLASGRPFEGRPVMISFDDGYRDFHQVAWPILRANDFCAEVFVVTDRVGGTADWDASYGAPAPLMGWAEIQALGREGVRFGSHMASHSHLMALSSREIVLEAVRSRALIARALGTECLSIAAPFGEVDDRFVDIAARCGFTAGLTTEPGFARLSSHPLRLPRIEVTGTHSIEDFARIVRWPAA
jgi:peptidoglycan/xylan/chitin deacetylase (PgdA/CDA1 family)/SAM-dependent methyltransferase